MTQGDAVDRDLAVLRAALAPSTAAKRRVRRALVRVGSAPDAPSVRLRASAALKALGLLGAGLVAGYWLGLERALDVDEPRPAVATPSTSPAVAAPSASSADGARASAPVDRLDAAAHPLDPVPSRNGAATLRDRSSTALPDRAVGGERVGPRARPLHPQQQRALRDAAPSPAARNRSAELALLQRAERAIRAGEGALASSLVAELDERHPRPRFAEERNATRVLAECLLHEPGARVRAEAFLEALPTSVYSDRVRHRCGLAGASADASEAPSLSDGSVEREH